MDKDFLYVCNKSYRSYHIGNSITILTISTRNNRSNYRDYWILRNNKAICIDDTLVYLDTCVVL